MIGLFTSEKPVSKVERSALPKDSPGHRWAHDYLGRPVNLWGLRAGEDGRTLPSLPAPTVA
jgi:hypothetical protein